MTFERQHRVRYGLSPMQSGMLFHALLTGPTSGYDIEQMEVMLLERVDAAHLAAAFAFVTRRHPILASSFHSDAEGVPEQEVHDDVVVPLVHEDWTALSDAEREDAHAAFLLDDRANGFDIGAAPLQRVALFARGATTELVWTFHHLLLDGRSMSVVIGEVLDVYAAFMRGEAPRLPEAPRPYADYIAWLSRYEPARSEAFFKELLRGKATPTDLPSAEPAARPLPRQGYGEVERRVADDVARAARSLATRTRTTVGTVIQAAWALVLSRYVEDTDVLFGVTRACRRSALDGAADAMVGLFINTLPIRVHLDDERTVSELLHALRDQSLAMREHEHCPLVTIQGFSDIPRGTPLFETLLVFENRELTSVLRAGADPAWQTRTCRLYEQPSLPLNVTVVDDEHLQIRILFDYRRFQDAAVTRLARAVENAIVALTRDESRPLGVLDILAEDERRTILFGWNDTARPFGAQCIHQPFEQRASVQPTAIALELGGWSLTFAELDARANRLAHALRARGAGPGVYVGICFDRSFELVVAMLAIAKAGAAYLPLDPEHPAERLGFMLTDAGARFVVTQARHRALFTTTAALVLDGGDAAEVAQMPATALPLDASPDDVCYAIYTSGSTGQPKGVVLSHRAVVNTFDWVSRSFAVGAGDRLLFVTSPCFDLSVYDTFGALGAGATVVIASDAQLKDPAQLAQAITAERITVWDSAPAALQRLVPFFGDPPSASVLRLVMMSGDWIPLLLVPALTQAFPKARLVSLGGATEAAIWSNWYPIGALDPRWTSVPYGKPIQNARYHVVDRRMQPVPVGVAGDLLIGGACLAEGYLNRTELTAERFVDDPFALTVGERLYRTGDRARYFDDGNLEFLGRVDFQVKVRGFRVELGEVEAALCNLPDIRQAACTVYGDAAGQKSLAAYVVTRTGAAFDDQQIKQALARLLPDFMIPSVVVRLDAMPLSSNGKLDRKALPSPGTRIATAQFVAAETDEERAMVTLWEELLQRRPVGVTDSFFDLGGHSLLAVMLVSRAKKQLGVDVPLSLILAHPTIRALLTAVATPTGTAPRERHLVTLNAGGSLPPLFLFSGSGGYGFVFQRLSRLLGREQPVYVINAIRAEEEARGDRESPDHRTIEQMADAFEREIREVCPAGPRVLGGYSFGVLVAFEVARRFLARGEPVPLLLSFDGFAPGFPELLPFGKRMAAHANAFLTSSGTARSSYVKTRVQNVRRRLLTLLGRGDQAVPDIPFADEDLNQQLRELGAELWWARERYRPAGALPTEFVLLKSEFPPRWVGTRADDPHYGWDRFFTRLIHVEQLPGEHLVFFQEANLTRIAALITAYVAKYVASTTEATAYGQQRRA